MTGVQRSLQTCPEHDKLSAVSDQSQACGEFVDWLRDQGIVLAKWYEEPYTVARVELQRYGSGGRWGSATWVDVDTIESMYARSHRYVDLDGNKVDEPVTETRYRKARLTSMVPGIRELLAQHFDIDQQALENEKRAMLDALREAQR